MSRRDIEILDNGEEWDVIPEDTIEVSVWEALPFTIFAVVGIVAMVAGAFYRAYEFLAG